MKQATVTELKKYLKTLEPGDLENEIAHLFETFPIIKEYFSSRINPCSDTELLEKYKKVIEKEFTPAGNRFGLKYKACRDAIKNFQKVCTQKALIAELMFFYAEAGIDFTNTYGNIDEQFYSNISGAYANALSYVFENAIMDEFKEKAYKLMDDSQGIGWGFSDYLADVYYNYYADDEDEE